MKEFWIPPQDQSLQTGRARWKRRTSPGEAWLVENSYQVHLFLHVDIEILWINGFAFNKTSIHPAIYPPSHLSYPPSHLSISYFKNMVVSIFCFAYVQYFPNVLTPQKNLEVLEKPTNPRVTVTHLTESSCSWYLGTRLFWFKKIWVKSGKVEDNKAKLLLFFLMGISKKKSKDAIK